jgi:predicted ATPase with chaperone activity
MNHIAPRRRDEPSGVVRERVEACRLVQYQRNGANRLNSALSRSEVELDVPAQKLLAAAQKKLRLPPKPELFLLQVARTCADLSVSYSPSVESNHLAEAICYRHRWKAVTPTIL